MLAAGFEVGGSHRNENIRELDNRGHLKVSE